jgi:hypothetical protein
MRVQLIRLGRWWGRRLRTAVVNQAAPLPRHLGPAGLHPPTFGHGLRAPLAFGIHPRILRFFAGSVPPQFGRSGCIELRHFIERGVLPLQCKCIIDSRGDLSVELLDQSTGQNLVAGEIPRSQFDSCRRIATFVAEMKAQLAMQSGVKAVSRRG